MDNIAVEKLKSYIERLKRLDEELENIRSDISDIYKELKTEGFDVVSVKKILKLMKQDVDKRVAEEEMLKLYREILGV